MPRGPNRPLTPHSWQLLAMWLWVSSGPLGVSVSSPVKWNHNDLSTGFWEDLRAYGDKSA